MNPNPLDALSAGALADGLTLDSPAINRAIAHLAESGGGTLVFPPGRYLCGTIHLASKVHLHLQTGATLVGVADIDQYHAPEGDLTRLGSRWHRALLLGQNVTDLSITGAGTIDGNKVFDPNGEERMRGPHTILLVGARRVTLRDFTLVDSANYAVLLLISSQIVCRSLRIEGGWDGIHFRGQPGNPCRDIDILDCHMFTGDDCIAGSYWDRTLIAGCVLNSSCNPVRVIGPVEHLIIHDCLMYGPGRHPHITQSRHNCLVGIIIQPGAWEPMPGPSDDIQISRVTLHNVTAPLMVVAREHHPIGSVTVTDLTATGVYQSPLTAESWGGPPIDKITLRNCSIESTLPADPSAVGTPVVDPNKGSRTMGVWGAYFRHVSNVAMDRVVFHRSESDGRPAIVSEGVKSIVHNDLRAVVAGSPTEAIFEESRP